MPMRICHRGGIAPPRPARNEFRGVLPHAPLRVGSVLGACWRASSVVHRLVFTDLSRARADPFPKGRAQVVPQHRGRGARALPGSTSSSATTVRARPACSKRSTSAPPRKSFRSERLAALVREGDERRAARGRGGRRPLSREQRVRPHPSDQAGGARRQAPARRCPPTPSERRS